MSMLRSVACCLLALIAGALAGPSRADGGRLAGRLLDSDGEPVAGLSLAFVSTDGEGTTARGVESDKKGRFVVASLQAGTYRIELESSGWRIQRIKLEVREPGGARLGEFDEELPAGIAPTPFKMASFHRVNLDLVVAPADGGSGRGGGVTLAAARETSGALARLNALLERGEMEKLAVEAQQLLDQDPLLGGAWYLRGVALWRTMRFADGVDALRKALELEPDQSGIRGVLGAALLDLGDDLSGAGDEDGARRSIEDAAQLLAQECEKDPGNVTFLTNRVIALGRLGRRDEEVAALGTLIEADPQKLQTRLRLADLLVQLGRRTEALETLSRIPEPGHDTAVAIYNVAIEYYNEGNMDDSIAAANKARAIEPGLADLYRLLGRAHLAQGDREAALRELEEFLRLAPPDTPAESERAIVETLRGR